MFSIIAGQRLINYVKTQLLLRRGKFIWCE